AVVPHLDTHDRAVVRLDELLDQRGPIGAEVERGRARLEVGARVEALDERARAADVGLDENRKAKVAARLEHLIAMVHDDCPRIIHVQALEETDLERPWTSRSDTPEPD